MSRSEIQRYTPLGGGGGGGNTGLTSDSKTLVVDVSGIVGADVAVLTSNNLAPGTWLVTFSVTALSTSVGGFICRITAGTATVSTFNGARAIQGVLTAANVKNSASYTAILTITAQGTIVFNVRSSGGTVTALAQTDQAYPGATGYTAVKIA